MILVTTKRGQNGAPKVSYSGYFGIQNATALMDRMNSADAATIIIRHWNAAVRRPASLKKLFRSSVMGRILTTIQTPTGMVLHSRQHGKTAIV